MQATLSQSQTKPKPGLLLTMDQKFVMQTVERLFPAGSFALTIKNEKVMGFSGAGVASLCVKHEGGTVQNLFIKRVIIAPSASADDWKRARNVQSYFNEIAVVNN